MIPRSVKRFLGDHHLSYAVLPHRPAFTAQREAAAAHVPGREWAKTVACIADNRTILAMVPAPSFVDLERLRRIAGAEQIRLASEDEFPRLYPDCELGAIPPLGPLFGQAVYVDRTLVAGRELVFEAGSHSDAIRMKYDDFARVVQPTVGDFGRKRRMSIEDYWH